MKPDTAAADRYFQKNAMTAFIQIAAVILLVSWCWQILAPFVAVILWGMIIAIALFPMHESLAMKLGGREKLSATLFVVLGLAILIVPTVFLAESTLIALETVGRNLAAGEVSIPPPNESVAEWPLIGERIYAFWHGAATNLSDTLNTLGPQLRGVGRQVIMMTGSVAISILEFVASIIIAGVFMVKAEGGRRMAVKFASRLVGPRGETLTDLSIATIRSVAKGVLGVAIVQALLAAIGFVAMDIPAAGLWTFAVLILAIAQIPQVIIMAPIAIYVYSVAAPVPATIFLIYAIFVSTSDGILKPMFLGRGVEIPMLVILLGAIGGMIMSGIIGLFIGAVVLALGYRILMAWMETAPLEYPDQPAAQPEAN